jgi:hypothetical protein
MCGLPPRGTEYHSVSEQLDCVSLYSKYQGAEWLRFNQAKTLTKVSLTRDGYNTPDTIVELLQRGKGVMPTYAEVTRRSGKVIPAKLTGEQMLEVAEYVLEQAESGWPTKP